MPLPDPIRLYQALAHRRHGPLVFRAALALQLAWLRLQLAVCEALRCCPPLHPWAVRRTITIGQRAHRLRLRTLYLLNEL